MTYENADVPGGPAASQRRIELSTQLVTFAATDPGGWEHVLERAELLDRAGFDRLVVSDHVVFGEDLDAYGRPEVGGTAGGRQPTGPDGHWLEPLTTLSVIAGRTRRIRLGTNILLAALRRPVVLAKTAATLDVLSNGRLDIGVGVGWQREEYEAAGLDFAARGLLLDECLDVCRTLWAQERAAYTSDRLQFEGIHMMPKPVQPGGVPIWVSGTVNPRVVRRIARIGAGWIPWGPDAADPVQGIARMKSALADVGAAADDLAVVATLPAVRSADGSLEIDQTMDQVPALVAAGATDLRLAVPPTADPDAVPDHLAAVVSAFRERVRRSDQV
jgi:probable F420-dependent oxidoreductase